METSAADVTERFVLPEIWPDVAVILVEPTPWLLATPAKPDALLMVATAALPVVQVTVAVRFWVELSV
jgi:hypothetical protein